MSSAAIKVLLAMGKTGLSARAAAPLLHSMAKPSGRKVLFGARNGAMYMDNSRHLFEWVCANEPSIDAVWITRSDQVEADLRARGLPVARADKPEGVKVLLEGSVGVYSNRPDDLAIRADWIPPTLQLVFLGHGKSVKATRLAMKHGVGAVFEEEIHQAAAKIAFAASTSPLISELTAQSQGLRPEQLKVTGYPRNDELLAPGEESQQAREHFVGDLDVRAVALYAPTWRQGRCATRFFPFDDFQIEKLKLFLKEEGILLLLRPHLKDDSDYDLPEELKGACGAGEFLQICDHERVPDVNSALPAVDILLSDYSSIYHDYLLLNRPVLLIPYDLEEFEEAQGFMYDYRRHRPGPHIGSFAELCEALRAAADEGEGFCRDEREELRGLIHTHLDARSCERTTAEIKKLLEAR